MDQSSKKKIKITKDGPYQVTGHIPFNQLRFVADKKGASSAYKEIQQYKVDETYYLCRCGRSNNYPFCDGSHLKGEPFNGTETSGHKSYDQMAEKIEGVQVDLLDAEELCAVARFCDTYGSTWNLVAENNDPKSVEIIKQQCANCPSGRLTMVTKEGEIQEEELPQEISMLEDIPAEAHGPIWVKGGIPIEDANGRFYPIRQRVTLCRCGKSKNKPFCDASHMQNQGELKE